MKQKRGSTMVEAAILFPLAILLVAGVISVSLTMHSEVTEDSQNHTDIVLSDENFAGVNLCFLMRGKGILE